MWREVCYKAFNKMKTYSEAAAACRADSGTLAIPRDAETNAFLISLHKSVSDGWRFWIGLHDQRKEGRFEWVDGSALGSYNSWGPGEPNNFLGKEDCVSYSSMLSHKEKWNDENCRMPNHFICQAAQARILDSEAPQGALKRKPDDLRQLSATVEALKRDQDALKRVQDALKRGQDALKRDQDALKRNQDALKRAQDALKRDQDALKQRDQNDVRRLSTTADALKRRTTATELHLHKIGHTITSCPKGYIVWRGTCYKAFKKMKTFSQAAAACREDGGTLAMPRDAGTDAFLISLHKSVSDHWNFWIGLHDQREEGRFEWVDGSPLGSYSSWGPEEPNNFFGMQDCVCYSAMPHEKDKWDDQQCFMLYYFICQAAPERP
ncbi:uncharacterized protein LOC144922769 [Branchiostoma floridae x Branchiostoma belcheri]